METPDPLAAAAAAPESPATPEAQAAALTAPDDRELLAYVEAFLERSGMSPSRFGLEAMREGGLVKSLRDGRSLSLKNTNKVLAFIRERDEQAKEAQAASPRPFSSPSSPPDRGPGQAPPDLPDPAPARPSRLLASLADAARMQ